MDASSNSTNGTTRNPDGLLGLQRTMALASNPRRPVVGSWMQLPGASLARMIAQMGFDFVVVDCEHGNIADSEMHAVVGAIAAQNASPVVRIPAAVDWLVKRALDTGAHAILCPMMSTAEDARKLVQYAKFPAPKDQRAPGTVSGIRGAGSPFAPAVFHQTMGEYLATANRNTLIAVQIESVEGLENCEEIARADGIATLLSPNDLCASMGFPPLDHAGIPQVQEAIARILAAAKDAKKYAGIFCVSAEQARARYEQGFDLVNLGADIIAIGTWNSVELTKMKDLRP
ncbi:Pyruvate/Phosphoenolpyruvate kinase-like domain-containing protein [Schizophyllum fasciatum]